MIDAAIAQAADDQSHVLIEATSNQVDQLGEYTGMRPTDFRDMVFEIADRRGYPRDLIMLAGDHLGPNRWQRRPAVEAMANAEALVAAYVEGGYTKIHLDCSMSCADDAAVLGDEAVAARSAPRLRIADETAERVGTARALSYVIGTEVPVPGGAHKTLDGVSPTPPERARNTIEAHRAAFAALGLDDLWPRITALVVQPGVEFDHMKVVDCRRAATTELRRVLDTEPNLVSEAHSTDYQRPAQLRELVEDHWAILAVGPALAFALREALFALAMIESETHRQPCAVASSRRRPLAGLLRRARGSPTRCPPVQLQRPAALLLGGPAHRQRPKDIDRQSDPNRHSVTTGRPVSSRPIPPDPRRPPVRRSCGPGHRPEPRRAAAIRPSVPTHDPRGSND